MPRQVQSPRAATEPPERGRDFVDALAKGLSVLAAFERNGALGNGELAGITGLPKATVSRLTGTLVALGYLHRVADSRKYVIGSRVLRLGASVQHHMRLQQAARPLMQQLADALELNIVLGTRDGLELLLLEIARPPQNGLTSDNDIGSHLPMLTTAIGMSCLVATPVRERARLLDELQRREDCYWSGGVRERIECAHAEYLRQRFIVSTHSAGRAVAAAATPLVLERGRAFSFAAIGRSVDLSASRLTRQVGPALVDMVARIARELGGSPAAARLAAPRRPRAVR